MQFCGGYQPVSHRRADGLDTNNYVNKLYFPLAEERNKWKMFSHTPLGPGPEGLFFESHAQCLSVAILLSAIANVYF